MQYWKSFVIQEFSDNLPNMNCIVWEAFIMAQVWAVELTSPWTLVLRGSSRNRCLDGVTFGENLKLVCVLRWAKAFLALPTCLQPPRASHARTGPFFFRDLPPGREPRGGWDAGSDHLASQTPKHHRLFACAGEKELPPVRMASILPVTCGSERPNRSFVLPSWWSLHLFLAQLGFGNCQGGPPTAAG